VVWAAVRSLVVVLVGEEAVWAPGRDRAEGRAPVRDRAAASGQVVWVPVQGPAVGRVVVSALGPVRGSVVASGWADRVPDPGREAPASVSAAGVPARGAASAAPAAAAGSASVQEVRTTWAFATAWVAG
jgi:hypothetical protein